MAELDFSKIFGETATSKAEFTNENYLRGWGYLGSTPPPYQLFDYLQSQNDKKAKFLYDKVMSYDGQYVPLSGGTMTGNLVINNGTEFSAVELDNTTHGKLLLESMAQNSDSVGHIIYRNGSDTQAKLNIPKKTGTLATLADVPAPVDLNAHNADENAHTPLLNKWINGTFDKFKTEVKNVVVDGLAEILDTQYKLEETGYVRMGFLGGFTIQWGHLKNVVIYDGHNYTVQFPISFSELCIGCIPVIERQQAFSGANTCNVWNKTLTSCALITDASNSAGNADITWFAFGF